MPASILHPPLAVHQHCPVQVISRCGTIGAVPRSRTSACAPSVWAASPRRDQFPPGTHERARTGRFRHHPRRIPFSVTSPGRNVPASWFHPCPGDISLEAIGCRDDRRAPLPRKHMTITGQVKYPATEMAPLGVLREVRPVTRRYAQADFAAVGARAPALRAHPGHPLVRQVGGHARDALLGQTSRVVAEQAGDRPSPCPKRSKEEGAEVPGSGHRAAPATGRAFVGTASCSLA